MRNFRWNYIRSGYLICLTRDGKDDWFLLSAPKRSHKGLSVTVTMTCQHVCAQLNKKNLYLTFDDENGIGTAEYLLRQVLENTGWQLGYCEIFYEQDGKTEKVRSLSSDGKRGAYLLISDICALFDARPVFDGDSRELAFAMHDEGYIELAPCTPFERSIAISHTENSNIVTSEGFFLPHMTGQFLHLDGWKKIRQITDAHSAILSSKATSSGTTAVPIVTMNEIEISGENLALTMLEVDYTPRVR